MSNAAGSKRNLFVAALVGGMLMYGASYLMAGGSDEDQKMASMKSRIKDLEASLATAQGELKNARWSSEANSQTVPSKTIEVPKRVKDNAASCSDQMAANTGNTIQTLRNLEISPVDDSRSFVERINDLLSGNPTRETISIAIKGIFDMARDREHLPDETLQALYNTQTDPDLKRVVAQVLSQRGNDTLLDDQVSKAQAKLKSAQPRDRQDALDQLAKLHNAKAADAIVPLLRDPDTDVKLDALLALRNNGNAMHVGFVELMRNDPSPAVRSLANDVASDLKDLSGSARTSMSTSDIEAGLPPL